MQYDATTDGLTSEHPGEAHSSRDTQHCVARCEHTFFLLPKWDPSCLPFDSYRFPMQSGGRSLFLPPWTEGFCEWGQRRLVPSI